MDKDKIKSSYVIQAYLFFNFCLFISILHWYTKNDQVAQFYILCAFSPLNLFVKHCCRLHYCSQYFITLRAILFVVPNIRAGGYPHPTPWCGRGHVTYLADKMSVVMCTDALPFQKYDCSLGLLFLPCKDRSQAAHQTLMSDRCETGLHSALGLKPSSTDPD